TDSILVHNPCARILLFMTWGRRFGGQQCINGNCSPVFVDFNHMQDSLQSAYESFAAANHTACAPVGVAWKKALEDTSMVLHSTDNSHPALTGSYLAACVFYTMFWKDASSGGLYTAGLSASVAARFQEIADSTVFLSSSDWGIDLDVPVASFTSSVTGYQADFVNTSIGTGSMNYQWDFGDGTTSSSTDPSHQYATGGTYTVTLMADNCGNIDSFTTTVTVLPSTTGEVVQESALSIYPQPADKLCKVIFRENGKHCLKVHDLQGKLLSEERCDGTFLTFITENLPQGFYILIIDDIRKTLSVVH
ncbi:MAG: PKD domain-containing protein, partial [Flavobacteriales bacterium]